MSIETLRQGVFVLIADGEKALILENVGDEEYPNLEVRRLEEQDNPPDRDQKANRSGRYQDTGSAERVATNAPTTHRSAMEEVDFHQLAKERFADDLADLLYKMAHRHDFERLVLVAPPQILGELRDKMHKEVASRVVGEVPKTLTNHPLDQVEELLKKEVNRAA